MNLRLKIQQREDSLGGGDRVLHFGIDPCKVLDGPEHHHNVRDKRLQHADRQGFTRDLQTALPEDQDQ